MARNHYKIILLSLHHQIKSYTVLATHNFLKTLKEPMHPKTKISKIRNTLTPLAKGTSTSTHGHMFHSLRSILVTLP